MDHEAPHAPETSPPWKISRKGRKKPKLDTVYVLALSDQRDGIPCYKLGATNQMSNGLWRRIANIRAGSKLQCTVVTQAHVGIDAAPDLERLILSHGVKTDHTGWQGHHEVRALTDAQLQSVLNIIEQARIPHPLESAPAPQSNPDQPVVVERYFL